MSITPNARDLLEGHITLELESIDRLYLNGYVPQLQYGVGLVGFLCRRRGQPIASPALLGQITGKFVAEVKAFAKGQGIPLFHFFYALSEALPQITRAEILPKAGRSLNEMTR